MAQFARPTSDVSIGAWKDYLGAAVDIYESIDEAVEDDSDYVESEITPSSSLVKFGLGAVTDPTTNDAHTMRYAIGKPAGAGQIDIIVDLVDASGPTVVATRTYTDVPGGFTTHVEALTQAEANAIADYSALEIHFTADAP